MLLRRKTQAQVAVEYLLVLSLGMFLLLSGLYVFFSYSASTNSRVAYTQIEDLGNSIILTADSVASMSPNSWQTVNAKIPDNVLNITIYNIGDTSVPNELVFTTQTQTSSADVVIYTTLPIVGNTPSPDGDHNITLIQPLDQPFPGNAEIRITSYKDNITISRAS